LNNEALYQKLTAECSQRVIKTWDRYLQEMVDFIKTLQQIPQ